MTCGIPVGGLVEATRPIKASKTDLGISESDYSKVGFSHMLDKKYDLNQYYLAYRFELIGEDKEPTSSNKKFIHLEDTYSINPDKKPEDRLYLLAGNQHIEGSIVSHSGATFKIEDSASFGQKVMASFSVEQNSADNNFLYIKGKFDPSLQLDGYNSNEFYLGRLTYVQKESTRLSTERRSFERGPSDLLNDSKYADTYLTVDDIQANAKLYVHLYALYEVFQSGAGKRQNSGEFIYIGSLLVPGL